MPASTREAAIAAVTATLAAALPALQVARLDGFPDDLGATSLVAIEDGDPGAPDVTLSPLTYSYAHTVKATVLVAGKPDDLPAKLDGILQTIGTTLEADRTLAGAIEYLELAAPSAEALAFQGAPGIRATALDITLYYTTTSPLA